MLLSKYKVKNYTFNEFKERYTENDINLVGAQTILFIFILCVCMYSLSVRKGTIIIYIRKLVKFKNLTVENTRFYKK